VHLYHTCHPAAGELVLRRNDSITKGGFFTPDRHSIEALRIGIFDPVAVDRIIHALELALIEAIGRLFDADA
jgi:hypothetical protein